MNLSPHNVTLLIIDDDAEIRYSLDRVLAQRQYNVLTAASGEEGLGIAEREKPHLIFLDNRMDGISGIETLQHLRTASPRSMVILMTAYGTTQTAIEAMKFGAFDYIIKPFNLKKVLALTHNAIEAHQDLAQAESEYRPLLDSEDYKEGIVGSSEIMQEVLKVVGQVTATDATVLITGESGTGKELVARCIYQHSHRGEDPFLAVNCAAIPENLIESELFGHEKGAFTGATNLRIGKFELCDGGTLFLDEIGDMAPATQTKILRALQEGEIQRVGGTSTLTVDIRLIAATNQDLEKQVAAGRFREDLYYRLNVVRIRMPALRERPDDIPQLVDFFLQRMYKSGKTRVKQVSADALNVFMRYRWPGNVRELENVIQRSAVVAQGESILVMDCPPEILENIELSESAPVHKSKPTSGKGRQVEKSAGQSDDINVLFGRASSVETAGVVDDVENISIQKGSASPDDATFASTSKSTTPIDFPTSCDILYERLRNISDTGILQIVEKELIQRALTETGGNQVKTSAILGITRATLRKRINQYSLKY